MTDLRERLQTALGGAYALDRELGGGGMSRVFVAEDAALKRRIVVKVLPLEIAADVSIARFQREITLAATLQHPHIVPLLSTGEMTGVPFYTMPFVEGETLRQRLTRSGELPIAEAVRLLREIATALEYAHGKGVVHRDIKPENVLLSGDVALVADFGIAKALVDSATSDRGALTATGISVGTPAYMSPEQVSADPGLDHRADLYAFGMIAYEMLAGQSPFSGRTGQALLAAHVIDTPEPLDKRRANVPPALAALVMRCLEKRPADRPQRASEIVRVLDGLTVPTQSSASTRAASRGRSRFLIAASALLVAGAGIGWWRFGRTAAPAPHSSRVLVAPFENLTGDPRFDYIRRMAADEITQVVAQAGSIDVVPSNIVLMALRDTTGGEAARLNKLSAATNAGLLVTGTVRVNGDSVVVQGQVTDVRTGTIVHTLVPATGLAASPVAALDALGDRLLGALGRSRAMVIFGEGYRAPTYAAYREFAAGFERFAVAGDVIGSRPFFERAIALDSTYTRAYVLLGRQYLNAGEFDRADSMARRIERLPQGLSAVERLFFDYMRAELAGDIPGLLRAQERLVERDSNTLALELKGEAAMYMLRPDIAVPALERSTAGFMLMGGQGALNHVANQAEAYHQAAMHDRELRVVTDGMTSSDPAYVRSRQLRAYAGLARPAAAMALADTIARIDGGSWQVIPTLTIGAAEFRAHGDTATAAGLLTMARAWIAANPQQTPPAGRRFQEGVVMLMSGMPDSALVLLPPATATSPTFTRVVYIELARIARGDRAHARVVADSLGAVQRRWLFGRNTFYRAAIHGALGERERAVELLRQAYREGYQMQSWHYDVALTSLHGFRAFEELVRPKR